MQKIVSNVVHSRAGGAVKRCHTLRHIGEYNNAQHQWGVAILLYQLFQERYAKLSIYALTHDLGEFWYGDVPATAKWVLNEVQIDKLEQKQIRSMAYPTTDHLSPEEQNILKACDALELFLWCDEQLQMGNMHSRECARNIYGYLKADWVPDKVTGFLEEYHKKTHTPSQCLAT